MAIRIRLSWEANNSNESGHRIYRSGASMDPENLPVPLATLGANEVEYVDEAVVENSTYFYRVGAFNPFTESVSAEISVQARIGVKRHEDLTP